MAKRIPSPRNIRASWSGPLRFGLVTFPVDAITVLVREEKPFALHQLHEPCHSRIRYEKHCPIHGKVSNDEIISGYEYSKGKYVEITPEELDSLQTDAERALTIDHFIDPDDIDPIFYDGRIYYLVPKGTESQEPYAVFQEAMKSERKCGIGQVVFSGKEQLVLLRAIENLLCMMMLNYDAEIRKPAEVEAVLPHVTSKKVQLAKTLIESWGAEKFEYSDYEDRFHEKEAALIAAKVEGKKVVIPETEKEPAVINLMDALRKSVVGKGAVRRKVPAKPAKKSRPTRRKRA